MFNNIVLIFIFSYFYNICSFILYIFLLENSKINNFFIKKFFNIFFFFSLSGLPIFSLFFFKLHLFINISKKINIIFIIIFIIVFIISIYVYYVLIKKILQLNFINKNNNFLNLNKNFLNIEKIVYFNVYYNIFFSCIYLFF